MSEKVFITGTAGFIGFHLSRLLLSEGYAVHGYDGLTDYYDVSLKQDRHRHLLQHDRFTCTEAMLEDHEALREAVADFAPDVIIHLAAQAGVRYSLEHPRSYVSSNMVGTFNVMEAAEAAGVRHLLMASTSSVYGASDTVPFKETDKVDAPLTIYAASKKANEIMAHSWAHLHHLPTTLFRFFTVYGPWGRPDMAYFSFTDRILKGLPIDIYNHGDMSRDFTYVDDLVRGIRLLMDTSPVRPGHASEIEAGDSLSAMAPFRIVNIGNSQAVRLLDFIEALEDALGVKAERRYLPMQKGDVPRTFADASLLQHLTGYSPQTGYKEGLARFVEWYRDYYKR